MRLPLRVAAVAVLAFASTAGAQATATTNRWTVTPRAGFINFHDASGIGNSPAVGFDAVYHFGNIFGLSTGLGMAATFARPQTEGNDFIGNLYLGDTVFLYRAEQPLTVSDLNLIGTVSFLEGGMFSPYLLGGVGGYILFLDPQVSGRVGGKNRIQRMSVNLGGGVNVRLGDRAAVMLDVRNVWFRNFDREDLNPLAPAARNTRFLEDFPSSVEPKLRVGNLLMQIGFTFIPTFGGAEEGGQQ